MSQALDIHNFPLYGSQLIEASAGTGKTFTIALLYVRLVLQHGTGLQQPLLPEQILVVTFTEAATQELRTRIRVRLSEAARCFLHPDEAHDPILSSLRDSYSADQWAHCGRLLFMAAQNMDQAAVSTIHGWCYRMLREHAFDSGSLFHLNLVADQRQTLADLVRDYWRQVYYTLDEDLADLVHSQFPGPDKLLKKIEPLLGVQDASLTFADSLVAAPEDLSTALQPVARHRKRVQELHEAARRAWLDNRIELEGLMDDLRPVLNKNTYREAKSDEQFQLLKQALYDWARGGSAPDRLRRFAAGSWKLTAKAASPQPDHPALHALATYLDEHEADNAEENAGTTMLLHCFDWMLHALADRQRRYAELGFDDLLRRLDSALSGPQGAVLAARIRAQFPAVLIDEFQDTDPLQYRIFNTIYDIENNRSDCALILIGDPKQAIYSFRQADIYTYLAARRATLGRHHHLQRNYRSTQQLVNAVNTLFNQAEQSDRGAFLFRSKDEDPLPFLPVSAQGRTDTLSVAGSPQAGMTIWHLTPDSEQGGVIPATRYQDTMATVCAETIASLLNGADSAAAACFHDGPLERPVRPKDIAVLVRNRKEAKLVRSALAARGLSSAYLSDQESVFSSLEAKDILFWLRACADPTDERKVRAALASGAMMRSLGELTHLFQQEEEWEEICEMFRALQRSWHTRGVLAMLRQLIHTLDVPHRLMTSADGERRLTNLLHLAEYLQTASAEYEGELALIRHLEERIHDPGKEEILRLESDADLIRVATIHKSKGLEYPLVFVPFAADWRPMNHQMSHVQLMDPQLGRRIELGTPKLAPEAWQQADDERLAEDVRLTYVALTRATHALWISVAPLTKGNSKKCQLHCSALGSLLSGGNVLDEQTLSQQLAKLQQCDGIHIVTLQEGSEVVSAEPNPQQQLDPPPLRPAREAIKRVDSSWWIASYSALQIGGSPVLVGAARDELRLEEASTVTPVMPASSAVSTPRDRFTTASQSLHGFPRGPGPGTFLHGLLEWAAKYEFSAQAVTSPEGEKVIEQRCRVRGWDRESTRVQQWLSAFLTQRFRIDGANDLCLQDLNSFRVEMEFLFPVTHVNSLQIDKLCQAYLTPNLSRPPLQSNQLHGMMKGFIDLVAEHEGRFYVIDWKSNYLGPDDSHYDEETLAREMMQHRYDVQYALYLLALHRLLRNRLPEYHYEHQVGGAMYFFLRGWQAETQGLLTLRPPLEFIDKLDRLFNDE